MVRRCLQDLLATNSSNLCYSYLFVTQEFNLDAEIQVNFAVGLAGMKSVANRRCLKFGELKRMGTEAQTGQGTI